MTRSLKLWGWTMLVAGAGCATATQATHNDPDDVEEDADNDAGTTTGANTTTGASTATGAGSATGATSATGAGGAGAMECTTGEKKTCFEGDPALEGTGICKAGEQTCILIEDDEFPTTSWGPCEGSVGPTVEVCDGIDNDCNGKVDEPCNKPIPMPIPCAQLGPAAQNVMTNYPASVSFPMNCGPGGYVSSNYTLQDPGYSVEMHVIGVYEGLQGKVEVVVKPTPKPVILVLSSYESVSWQITLSAGAALDSVVLQGYDPQSVLGVPANVPVTSRSFNEACAYAYGWEPSNNQGGGDYKMMISSARAFIGMDERSFQGCYTGAKFEIPF